jgi:uncharacterized repeat protein (TIGR04076 family)
MNIGILGSYSHAWEKAAGRRGYSPSSDRSAEYYIACQDCGLARCLGADGLQRVGDYFELRDENLSLPPGQNFPLYPLAAPLAAAKQRPIHPHDWMTTDMEIACPDPLCGGRFRITRIGESSFRHSEVTAVPLAGA